MVRIVVPSDAALAEAGAILRQGGLIGLPTETVYGLAANALDGQAVAKIFAAKGRPSFNPLIVHVADPLDAKRYAMLNAAALDVMEVFWPGPLTLILPRIADCPVSELATAGLDTIALRCPAHPVARDVIRACGFPLAAPSANRSGHVSPTSAQHVADDLGDAVDLIIASGSSCVGLESTVLDLSGDTPVILRPGAITAEDIGRVLDKTVSYDLGNHHAPRSPGQLLRHYATTCPIRLNAIDAETGEALLAFGPASFQKKRLPETSFRNLSEAGDLHEAAANLFGYLRALDAPAHRAIAVMPIPDTGLGLAINDRLRRAAEK